MGLDSVEIVMGWEESFGIQIADEEATVIRTPQMAIDLIATKLGTTKASNSCLTLRAFHKLRTAIVAATDLARNKIKPTAKIRDLITSNRKQTWKAVQDAIGLPSLPFSRFRIGRLFGPPITVQDVTSWIITHCAKDLKNSDECWTLSEIRMVVRAVVTEVTGSRGYSGDDDFVKNIGID